MYVKDIVRLDKRKVKVVCEEITFSLYTGEIKKYNIQQGETISQTLYCQICEELYKRAKERSLHLLEKMDRTEQQIKNKLKEGYYPEDIIERVIAFLNKYNFINDEEYAKKYVEYAKKTKSIKLILSELAKKGISKEILSDIKWETDNREGETNQIIELLYKKKYKENYMDTKEKNKIISYLLRRGYAYEDVNVAIKRYMEI